MRPIMNVGRFLTNTARLHPNRIGLVHGACRWTWREIDASVNAMSAALEALGVGKGDRVLVQSKNTRYLFESMYAITKAGAVYVPINARLAPAETAYVADHCRAKVFMFHPEHLESAKLARSRASALQFLIAMGSGPKAGWADGFDCLEYDTLVAKHSGAPSREVEVVHDDPAWQNYTAGTTGNPKGAVMSHGQLTFVLVSRIADAMPGLSFEDASLVIAPLTHGAGTTAACNTIRGAKTVIPEGERFDEEECWRLIEQHRIANLFTVPTILMRLINHPAARRYDRSSLKHVLYAGSPITRADQKKALELLGSVLVQYYGATENMGTAAYLAPYMHSAEENDPHAPPGSCGIARSGMEIAIMNDAGERLPYGAVGEICLRGLAVFPGYFDDPAANAAAFRNGWYLTGDLGRMDELGFVYIVGRSREMYISGGFNVYPNEVENALARHEAVREAAVTRFPDSHWGEVGVAVVSLKEGHVASEVELSAFVGKQLADYKRPKRIFIWDDIPKSAYGKVPKQLILDELFRRGLLREGRNVQ